MISLTVNRKTLNIDVAPDTPFLLDAGVGGGASSVTVDADPNAETFYLACGAARCGEVPAPVPGQSERVRPRLKFRPN